MGKKSKRIKQQPLEEIIDLDKQPYLSKLRQIYYLNRYKFLASNYPNYRKVFDEEYMRWQLSEYNVIPKIEIYRGDYTNPTPYLSDLMCKQPRTEEYFRIKKESNIVHYESENQNQIPNQYEIESSYSRNLELNLEQNRIPQEQAQPIQDCQDFSISEGIIIKHDIAKKGRRKEFLCQHCMKFKHFGKSQLRNHKKTCKNRESTKRAIRKNIKSKKLFELKVKNIEDPLNQTLQKDMASEIPQIKLIQNKIQKLEATVYRVIKPEQLQRQQIYQKQMSIVKQIIADVEKPIISTISIHMKRLVENAINSSIGIGDIKHNIELNLLNKINQMDFNSLIFDYSQKLGQAFHLVKIQDQNKDQRTIKNNNYAYRFLQKYNEFMLCNQTQLITDLMALSIGQRNNIRRFFKKIKRVSGYFCSFPDIPKIGSNVSWRRLRPILKIDEIAYEVVGLLKQTDFQQHQLAVDVWTSVCFGLRSPDLLRVNMICSNGEIAHSIKLIERKNRKESIRYIPDSLAQLIRKFKIKYPMTQKRFKLTRDFCINKFGSFYGARHLLICTVLASLSQSSDYAAFHKNSTVTYNHYLTSQQEGLLNSAFQLPIQFSSIQEDYPREIIIDMTCDDTIERSKIRSLITIDNANDINLEEIYDQDGIFTGQVNFEAIQANSELSEQKKLELTTSKLVFDVIKRQVLDCNLKDIEDAISRTTANSEKFNDKLFSELESKGLPRIQPNIIGITESLFNVKLILLDCDLQNKKVKVLDSAPSSCQTQKLYIARDSNLQVYHHIENDPLTMKSDSMSNEKPQLRKMSERKSKFKASREINRSSQVKITIRNPKCLKCKQGKYETILIQTKCIVGCKLCNDEIKPPKSFLKLTQSVPDQPEQQLAERIKGELVKDIRPRIFSISDKYLDLNAQCVDLKPKRNNLIETVTIKYGKLSYSNQTVYSPEIPLNISSNFVHIGGQLQKQLKINRKSQQFLPLQIKKSLIDPQGLGIFSTASIPPHKVILTYVGVIKSSYSFDPSCDSLFTLGWLSGNSFIGQVFIEPKEKLNAARFINSAESPNCFTRFGILEDKQIVIFIVSSKHIKNGQQITYDYGKKYFEPQQTQNNRDLDAQSEDQHQ